jgi:energy-coupling factor transporter ATP-binding protein EcfA2
VINLEKKKIDLGKDISNFFQPIKVFVMDPFTEVIRGFREKSAPILELVTLGCLLSFIQYTGGLGCFVKKYGGKIPSSTKLATIFGLWLLISGLHLWGIRQVFVRRNLQRKLERVFLQAGLKTKLEEFPLFIFDRPVGSTSRKLRLRALGLPVSKFREGREYLESGLNVALSKIENPKGNFELVDLIYSLERMPEGWKLEDLWNYKDFSFPVGKSLDGEIKTSLKKIPHFLVAGETGSGKSTFIRAMVSVLALNNQHLRVLFIDMKGGMENQVFQGFDRVELLSEIPQVEDRLSEITTELETRMSLSAKGRFKNIDEYNQKQKDSRNKWERILVVVDEAAEIVPSVTNPEKGRLAKIQSRINRFTRLGRAVGIHVVIGVQKPDHKNLDPTIKANLTGIICFPVSHFSQSVVVLGNSHASDLNAEFPGRGIWKHGSYEIEVQAPFLSQEDLDKANKRKHAYFQANNLKEKGPVHESKKESPSPNSYEPRREDS